MRQYRVFKRDFLYGFTNTVLFSKLIGCHDNCYLEEDCRLFLVFQTAIFKNDAAVPKASWSVDFWQSKEISK